MHPSSIVKTNATEVMSHAAPPPPVTPPHGHDIEAKVSIQE
jgi:hypothetical protein